LKQYYRLLGRHFIQVKGASWDNEEML